MSTKKRNDEFVSRWGDSELDDKQYASVPGWILRNYHLFKNTEGETVGLSPDEFQVMVHIMSFKYDVAESEARPSLVTVAEQVGKHISSVRRTIKRLETKGALTVDRQKAGHPNTYDFSELARQCRVLDAQRVVNEGVNATPSVDATPTPSVDASTPLAYTLPEEKNKLENKNESTDAPKAVDEQPKPDEAQKPKRKSTPKTLDNIKPIQAVVAYRGFGVKRGQVITGRTMTRINMVVKELRERWQNGSTVQPDELKAAYIWHVAGRGENQKLEPPQDPVKVAAMLEAYRDIHGNPHDRPTLSPPDPDCPKCGGMGLISVPHENGGNHAEICECRKKAEAA